MKLTVLMIYRDRPAYFNLAKKALENQTYKDFDVKYFYNRDQEGIATITNRWFLDFNTELVGKIDDDILLEPDCLGRLVEAHQKHHFGFLGPFHFKDEEMAGVEPKITSYDGIQIWERPHIGGNYVIRREDYGDGYSGEGNMGLSDFQWKIRERGFQNGFIYPFSKAEHMQDGRSKYCIRDYENKFGMSTDEYTTSFIRDSKFYLNNL